MPYFDLDTLKIGDKLWDFCYGWGNVENINISEQIIKVFFRLKKFGCLYSVNGVLYSSPPANQTLFYDEIKFTPPPRPKRRVKKEGWLAFWKDDHGVIRVKGTTTGHDFFIPNWYSSREEAIKSNFKEYKNTPEPVKVEWEEEE